MHRCKVCDARSKLSLENVRWLIYLAAEPRGSIEGVGTRDRILEESVKSACRWAAFTSISCMSCTIMKCVSTGTVDTFGGRWSSTAIALESRVGAHRIFTTDRDVSRADPLDRLEALEISVLVYRTFTALWTISVPGFSRYGNEETRKFTGPRLGREISVTGKETRIM